MLYFIAWVVLMLAAILAIPIASLLEKRKLKPAGTEATDEESEAAEEDELEPLEEGEGPLLEEGAVEAEGQSPEEAFDTGAPDDFSAFEEEFK